jgi:hypothetical protein
LSRIRTQNRFSLQLYALLQTHGFQPVEYSVSERYRVCMEVIAIKPGGEGRAWATRAVLEAE